MKKITAFTLIVLFLYSCDHHQDNKNITVTDSLTTVTPTVTPPSADSILKDVTVDGNYFTKKTAKASIIKPAAYKTLGLENILKPDELKEPTAKLRILDTLINNALSTIIILSRETENEHWAWLVQYDQANKFIFSKQVYYEDFVEYFYKTTSVIKDNKLTIKKETQTEESSLKEYEKYIFSGGQTLKLVFSKHD